MDKEKSSGESQRDELFIQLVTMFQVAAMQHMGKILNPVTNKIETDLKQAKISIDMISMIKEKTRGNLDKAEEGYLDKVLFELQMNYVDETNRSKERKEGPNSEAGGEGETRRQTKEAPGDGGEERESGEQRRSGEPEDRNEPRE